MTSDEQLRAAYTRAVEAHGAPERARCVPAEALLALVRGEGRENDRLATLDHTMACAACRAEFELLRSIERAGGQAGERVVRRIRWPRYAAIALAASTVFAISLGPARRLWDRDREPMRGNDLENGVVIVAPAAGAVLRPEMARFIWRTVPGARRYTVEVLTPDGTLAAGAETTDTTLVIGSPRPLSAGEYRWVIVARLDDGTERRSDARDLRIRE